MINLWEDKEANLIESFRRHTRLGDRPVCLLSNAEETRRVITSIIDDEIWKNEWADSSSKEDPPPDFYSESQKLMMEVMRIDDHAFEQDGRIINRANQRAREAGEELIKSLGLKLTPNAQLFVNAPTGLPSSEDHNYRYYKSNFKGDKRRVPDARVARAVNLGFENRQPRHGGLQRKTPGDAGAPGLRIRQRRNRNDLRIR